MRSHLIAGALAQAFPRAAVPPRYVDTGAVPSCLVS
jgi:hypothetical protein